MTVPRQGYYCPPGRWAAEARSSTHLGKKRAAQLPLRFSHNYGPLQGQTRQYFAPGDDMGEMTAEILLAELTIWAVEPQALLAVKPTILWCHRLPSPSSFLQI